MKGDHNVSDKGLRVAIIGCGRLGQRYADLYSSFPDTEIVAIAEWDSDRRKHVGEKYGVAALYPDADALFREVLPDIAAVVTPSKYYKDAVVAAAQAGVKSVSTDKPIEATLSNADEMVDECASRGIIFSGGALIRAIPEIQEAATWIREGRFGQLTGAAVLNWSGEISGSGCHTISVLRLLTGAEVEEVIGWGTPDDVLAGDCDWGLTVNGRFKLSNGIDCPVFGKSFERGCVEVWNEETLIRMAWGPPEIYREFDDNGVRIKTDPQYTRYDWPDLRHLTGSIRSFVSAVQTGDESRLWISGHDLRQALEVAIASHQSAQRGSVPIKLPLEDRSLTLYPRPYRWLGGDSYDAEGNRVEGSRTDLDV